MPTYTLDDWINFWDDNVMSLNQVYKRSISVFQAIVYPDYAGVSAAITIKDKDGVIERNGEVFAHILQKDFFNKTRKLNLKSHINSRAVYSTGVIISSLSLFPINSEMIFEVFVEKKAPAFLSCKDYVGWAIMFMPRIPQEDGNFGDCEELPKERNLSLKEWI